MQESKVVIVHLRRPNLRKTDEMRSDPFYEFGSFGCTGCHDKNLMNPKKIKELYGARLAFAQGGPEGFKLIQLTPPIKSVKYKNCCELKWEPNGARFFKYQNAPLLINNEGDTNFPSLKRMLQNPLVDRKTWAGKFSSKFRSSRQWLPDGVALELSGKYSLLFKDAPKEHFASDYTETMHKRPPKKDSDRAKTYAKFLHKANSVKSCKCKQKPY
jgi:hypothetical protein